MTKYAAYDEITIYAVGDTPKEAISNANDNAGNEKWKFETAKISDELAEKIERCGWNGNYNSFNVVHGYIVDTTDD